MADLSPQSESAFKAFAKNANWSSLHALDKERFGRFVVEVHRNGDEMNNLVTYLENEGCPEPAAIELGLAFELALQKLDVYDEVR